MPPIFHQKSRWAWIVCALLLTGFLGNSIGDYLVDTQGKIVLRPSNSPMLKYPSLQEIEGLGDEVDGLLAGKTDSLTYERGGENRIMNCRFVPELHWYLIVEQSEESLLVPLRQQLLVNLLIAFGMTALIGGICIFVVRSHKAGIEAYHGSVETQPVAWNPLLEKVKLNAECFSAHSGQT